MDALAAGVEIPVADNQQLARSFRTEAVAPTATEAGFARSATAVRAKRRGGIAAALRRSGMGLASRRNSV
jgi:hypothetical protein